MQGTVCRITLRLLPIIALSSSQTDPCDDSIGFNNAKLTCRQHSELMNYEKHYTFSGARLCPVHLQRLVGNAVLPIE